MDFSGMDFVTVLFYRVDFCTAHSSQLSVWRVNCSFLFEAIDLLLLRLFIDWFWLSTYHTITLLRHHRFTDRFILLYSMVLKPGFTGSFILSPTHLFYFYSFIAKLLQGLITNLNLFIKGNWFVCHVTILLKACLTFFLWSLCIISYECFMAFLTIA